MATVELASARIPPATSANLSFYYLLFFLSGFPALLYQIVWQRALFTLYGVNVESVTMIVTVFMLGLGLGSLAGGRLSAHPKIRPLHAFGFIEFSIGLFGFASLGIFHRAASVTAGHSILMTGIIAFALLLIPTMLMGSTLPLLVEHIVRRTGNVGESVGSLYCVNTFGSGVACLAAAVVLMRLLGETGSVRLACCFNLAVGAIALATVTPSNRQKSLRDREASQTIPLWISVLLAGIIGFVALAYEIIWYRLYSFTTAGTAQCFAQLLGFYLIGIAYGSLAVRDVCRQKLSNNVHATLWAAATVVLSGTITAFLLGRALVRAIVQIPFGMTYLFVFVAAALLGSAFSARPAVGPGRGAGESVTSTSAISLDRLSDFLIGFIVLDRWSYKPLLRFFSASVSSRARRTLRPIERSRSRRRMYRLPHPGLEFGVAIFLHIRATSGQVGLHARIAIRRPRRKPQRRDFGLAGWQRLRRRRL
jgi:MFS family permease